MESRHERRTTTSKFQKTLLGCATIILATQGSARMTPATHWSSLSSSGGFPTRFRIVSSLVFYFSFHKIFKNEKDLLEEKMFDLNFEIRSDGALNRRKFPGPNYFSVEPGQLRCVIFPTGAFFWRAIHSSVVVTVGRDRKY